MSNSTNTRMRRYWATAVTGLASAAVASAAACSLLPMDDVKTMSYDVVETAAINQSSSTVGIADPYLYGKTQAEIDQTLDAMLSLGVRDVRIMIPWAGVETWKGVYNWAAVDRVVNAAAARDMGVLGFINSTPSWAALNKVPLRGQPDPNVYATFAGKVAQRYKGKISAYEVWNEPNYYNFFSPISAAKYTQMLKAAYGTIKAQDPSALVIGGSVASVVSFFGVTLSPVTFVDQMYKAGAKGYFDALSFHPYHYTKKFSAGKTLVNAPYWQLEAIRKLMVTNGDSGKLIWNTEYGQPSNVKGEANQAEFISDILSTWKAISYAGPTFLFTTRDLKAGSTANIDNFGIFRLDWSPKPVADVIKQAIANSQAQATTLSATVSTSLQQLTQSVAKTVQQVQTSISKTLNPSAQRTTVTVSTPVSAAPTVPSQSSGQPTSSTGPTTSSTSASVAPASTPTKPETVSSNSSKTSDTKDSSDTTSSSSSQGANSTSGSPSTSSTSSTSSPGSSSSGTSSASSNGSSSSGSSSTGSGSNNASGGSGSSGGASEGGASK